MARVTRQMQSLLVCLAVAAALLEFAGCIGSKPSNPAATQPATMIDPAVAEPQYWLNQPATAEVTASDFRALWDASEAVAHDYLYQIDVRDYRRGLLKTDGVVSKQLFEPWRRDAGRARDVIENSAGPIRRTIYFYFARNADGSYTASPKVLVERRSKVDSKYRSTDADVPTVYWYALRRDTAMEEKVGADLRDRLRRIQRTLREASGPELGQG